MQLEDNGLFKLGTLKFDEKVPDEIINTNTGQIVFYNGQDLFRVSESPIGTFISEFKPNKLSKEDYVKKNFKGNKYTTNQVYFPKNRLSEYHFPLEDFQYIMKYFREIYNAHKSEAAVLLLINPETKIWKPLIVPQVNGSGASIKYMTPVGNIHKDMKEYSTYKEIWDDKKHRKAMVACHGRLTELLDQGFSIFGTIHSHCNFGAFHSGVDDADEQDFDGLHITIGNVCSGWSYAARVMFATAAFTQEITDLLKISSVSELDTNIDDIEISKEDMALFMSDVREVRTYLSQSTPMLPFSSSPPTHRMDWETWNPGEDTPSILDENDTIDEDDYVRLFDIQEGKAFLVKKEFMNTNSGSYPAKKYPELPFGPIPQELLDKHQEYVDADKELCQEIFVLDDNDVNPKYPATPKGRAIFFGAEAAEAEDFVPIASKKETNNVE